MQVVASIHIGELAIMHCAYKHARMYVCIHILMLVHALNMLCLHRAGTQRENAHPTMAYITLVIMFHVCLVA